MDNLKNYNAALLAEVSYVELVDENGETLTVSTLVKKALTDADISNVQAADFVENWSVIHQQPNMESGFSATLFQNENTKKYALAIRGTAGNQDLIVTDGSDIVFDGLAIDKIVDMWNYWQK